MSVVLAQKTLLSTLAWLFYRITESVTTTYRRSRALETSGSKQIILAKRRVVLRRNLSRAPRWVNGHAQLGLTELELLFFGRDPRLIAGIRVCGEALLLLSGHEKRKYRVLGHYLFSMAMFFERDVEKALSGFRHIIAQKEGSLLGEKHCANLFEQAAACSMTLSKEEDAREFLSAIPAELRSVEAKAALDILENPVK